MFPRRVSLLEVVHVCLQVGSSITLEDVAVIGECCPSGRGSSSNLHLLCPWQCITVGVFFIVIIIMLQIFVSPWNASILYFLKTRIGASCYEMLHNWGMYITRDSKIIPS